MGNPFQRKWSLVVLRGILAVLFGLAAFVWPAATLVVLVWMYGIYALLDGLFSITRNLSRSKESLRGWPFGLKALASIAAGVVVLIWPQLATLAIVFLIAGWAVLIGILEIAAAIRLRHEINNEWLLGLSGVVLIVLGMLLLIQPFAGGVAIIWTVAAFAIIFGVLLIVLGFRLRHRYGSGDRQALHSA